jgi:hypothetical protein
MADLGLHDHSRGPASSFYYRMSVIITSRTGLLLLEKYGEGSKQNFVDINHVKDGGIQMSLGLSMEESSLQR